MSNKFANALNKCAATPQATAPAAETVSPHERPARRGRKHVGGYFPPEVSKQLRQIALKEDSSVQRLLGEGIDMIFHSRKMPTIAHDN